MREEQTLTEKRRMSWRGRLLIGLASLLILFLLPLGLLYGYGAWLNSRPSPWGNNPRSSHPATVRGKNEKIVRDQTPTSLTLARVQAFVNEPEVKVLKADYVALHAKADGSSRDWSLGWWFTPRALDDHWIYFLDHHRDVLEQVKQLARQNVGSVIRQQTVYGGGPEPPPEVRLFCFDLSNLLTAQGTLALRRGQEAEALEDCRLLFTMGFPANPGHSLGFSMLMSTSFLRYWLESNPPGPATGRALSETIDSLTTSAMRSFRSTPATLERECLRRLAEEMQPYQQPWKSDFYGWKSQQSPSPGPSLMNWTIAKSDYFVQSWHAMQNKARAEEYLTACANYIQQCLNPEQDYPSLHALKPPSPPQFDFGDRYSIGPAINENIVADYRAIPFERQTRFNLNRAALAWLADPRSRPSEGAVDFHQHPAHPWRDPFSEKPFHVDQTDTGTLIYSVGPDLADQHGRVEYDPTNGTQSAGDIVIHVRNQHGK